MPTPDLKSDPKIITSGSSIGTFTLTIDNLKEGKTYYVRGFAMNTEGTGLGNIISFETKVTPTKPLLIIDEATNVNHNSASISAKITSNGGSNVTEQGFCWNTTGNPSILDNKAIVTPNNAGVINKQIADLVIGKTYFVKAYATNNIGTGYSSEINFKTTATVASLSTSVANSITSTSAKSGGSISSDGGASITAKGICWDTKQSPTIQNSKTNDGTGSGNFTSDISGLVAGVKYYVRAYATNSVGTNYGNELSFTTSASLSH